MQKRRWVKFIATGPKNLSENRRIFHCMICQINVSIRSYGNYETKRHYQSGCHPCQDQRFCFGTFLMLCGVKMHDFCMGPA